jgi:hypothetical protein
MPKPKNAAAQELVRKRWKKTTKAQRAQVAKELNEAREKKRAANDP